MPVTRSAQGREDKTSSATTTPCTTEGTASQETVTATTSATETTGTTAEVGKSRPTQARSRRSESSRKKIRNAELKLAEMRAAEAQAQLEAARARTKLAEAALKGAADESSSEEEDGEQDELASVRIKRWLQRPEGQLQPVDERKVLEKEREEPAVRKDPVTERPDRADEVPTAHGAIVGLQDLTAALSQLVTKRDPPKFFQELPAYNGHISGWLSFRAAYVSSESSFGKFENIARIRRALKGPALEAVSSLLVTQQEPRAILEALERRFGRPEALVLAELDKLRQVPKVNDSARELCVFAGRVANAVATVEALGRKAYLHSPEMVRCILEKLTPILRSKYYDFYASAKVKDGAPELKMMARFLNLEADKCGAYALPEVIGEEGGAKPKPKKEKAFAAVTAKPDVPECPQCKNAHTLVKCPEFLKADVSTRWSMARKHRMCFQCLEQTHRRFRCKAKPCSRSGCGRSHSELLHSEIVNPEPVSRAKEAVSACAAEPEGPPRRGEQRRAYLKIAPVELISRNAKVSTFALLDDGSTCTFVEESIAELLGVDGPSDTLYIKDANGGETKHENSKTVTITIRGRNEKQEHLLRDVQTIKKLNFITQAVPADQLSECHHLTPILDDITYDFARPKVVIGQNNWNLIVNREVREGRDHQPVASRTHLGWVLHGCSYAEGESEPDFCGYVASSRQPDEMEEIMKNFFKLESLGIQEKKPVSDPEQRAACILEEKSKRLPDGRFETGLLWREDKVVLHNNYKEALKRLTNLEKKLDRDSSLKARYNERIMNLLVSGYAERAQAPPTEGRTWYLPHFAVVNPAKPKIRVVHDAAAKSAGKSLNDMLLTGPDLLQSLPGVVMRFRQYPYAVSADIKEMFMQVRIQESDRDALRFLKDKDKDKDNLFA